MKITKFIFLFFFLVFINKPLIGNELIKPNIKFKPKDIIKIQLDALKKNDSPFTDFGIEQTWEFAHPSNKIFTGPLSNFKRMLHGKNYKNLLNHFSHEINLIQKKTDSFLFEVKVIDKNKKIFVYSWEIRKGDEKGCKNCWFTSSVAMPIEKGESI